MDQAVLERVVSQFAVGGQPQLVHHTGAVGAHRLPLGKPQKDPELALGQELVRLLFGHARSDVLAATKHRVHGVDDLARVALLVEVAARALLTR